MSILHTLYKNKEILEILVKVSEIDINESDDLGRTILHKSSMDGNADIVDFILANDGNVNLTDKGKYTPLHYALNDKETFNERVIISLIQKGADLNAKTLIGDTPFSLIYKIPNNNAVLIQTKENTGDNV